MEVDVDASEVKQVVPVKIRKHKLWYDPNGGLYCVGEVGVQRWFKNQRIRELHIPRRQQGGP